MFVRHHHRPKPLFGAASPLGCWILTAGLFLSDQTTLTANVQINWTLPATGFNHQLSDNTPLSDGYHFQIGSFEGSFVPTAANAADWSDNWRALSAEQFEVANGGISVAYDSDGNPANFPAGRQLYAFGYELVTSGPAEVFLATDPSWIMPADSPFGAPFNIDINLAATRIAGTVDSDDALQTAATTINETPPFYYSEWVFDSFVPAEQANTSITGISEDPDGDGLENMAEYLTGNDPNAWSPNPLTIERNPAGELDLASRLSGSARASFTLRQSNDLSGWTDSETQPVANATGDALELTIAPEAGNEFWRLRVDSVAP